MPASLQKFSDDHKIDPSCERPIQCPHCPQRYLSIGAGCGRSRRARGQADGFYEVAGRGGRIATRRE